MQLISSLLCEFCIYINLKGGGGINYSDVMIVNILRVSKINVVSIGNGKYKNNLKFISIIVSLNDNKGVGYLN